MSIDRPVFGRPYGSVVDEDGGGGLRPDGRIKNRKGPKRVLVCAVTTPLDGLAGYNNEDTPFSPDWLKESRTYTRWFLKLGNNKNERIALITVNGKEKRLYTADAGLTSAQREYGGVRKKAALVVDCRSGVGLKELPAVIDLSKVEPGGLLAVYCEAKKPFPQDDLAEFSDWVGEQPLTRERIRVLDDGKSLVLVGRKWKERKTEHDIRTTKMYNNWLRKALAEIDNSLREAGIEVEVQGRNEYFITGYILGAKERLLRGAGMILTLPCGCVIDMRKGAEEDERRLCPECQRDNQEGEFGKQTDILLKKVFSRKTRSGHPCVLYANADDQVIIKKRLLGRGIDNRYEVGNKSYNIQDLSDQHFIDPEIVSLEYGIADIEAGDGIVFQVGRKCYYGIAIKVRGFPIRLGEEPDPELKILILESRSVIEDSFPKYF